MPCVVVATDEKSALHHRNKCHLNILKYKRVISNSSKYYIFCIFIIRFFVFLINKNSVFVSIKDFFQKHKKILPTSNLNNTSNMNM